MRYSHLLGFSKVPKSKSITHPGGTFHPDPLLPMAQKQRQWRAELRLLECGVRVGELRKENKKASLEFINNIQDPEILEEINILGRTKWAFWNIGDYIESPAIRWWQIKSFLAKW